MLPRRTARPSRRRAPTSSTCATRRPGPTCSTASTSSATRRRWSAPASRSPTCRVRRPQRPRHRRAARRDARARASTGWCWPPRWWSTARAATRAPSTATSTAAPRRSTRSTAGDFENHCPRCGRAAGLGAGRRGRAARPAQRLRRQQGRPGALHARRGRGRPARGGRAALPQRLRPGHAAGHAVLRRRGDVPLLAGARRAAAGVRGRRPDARLRARRRRGPRQPRCAAGGDGRRDAGVRRLQRLLRAPGPDPRRGRAGGRGHRPRHRARGDRRLPARRRPARRRLAGAGDDRARLHRRGRAPSRGCRRSRPRRCGPDHTIRLRYHV